ncbi:MAG: phosphoglucosamine mutase [Acidimicrobiia bacterium]|nr:phosphoglucosamine mutase [Acidimicrobiia bacterium]
MKFGTDGVRGVANTDLSGEFTLRLGRAAARVLVDEPHASSVVIGGDTRESTSMLMAALAAGFASEGVDVARLGVVPTPTVAYEAQRRGAMGAVVSASHNPYRDNGIKLFAVGGTKLPDEIERRIERELATLGPVGDHVGSIEFDPDHSAYVDHLLRLLQGRSLDGLRVVVDTANGAASGLAPSLFSAAGAEVTAVADQPDGRNINDRCGATWPETVAAEVVRVGADLGIALDGDADRLIAVDHTGTVVDGDHIIAICAEDLRSRGELRDDTVVVTVMTNLGFRLAMRSAGIEVIETAVGDRYVLEALNAGGYSLGGEQSGHVIFSDHATTGDGLLTGVALLDIVSRTGALADLAKTAMTSLPQVLHNLVVAERVPDVAEQLAEEIAAVERRLGDTGRVLVRASGTEPLIRVMVEAASADEAESAAVELISVARTRFA